MTEKLPAPREAELLREAYRHIKQYGRFPDNSWLGKRLGGLGDNRICNIKSKLRKKGYLYKELGVESLTEEAFEYLEKLQSSTGIILLPLEIQVLGQVKAGKTKQDEISIYLHDPADADVPTVTIPHTKKDSPIFALEVKGQSMEHEGVFEGDYVIVEKFENGEKPKQNEMIVTRYLPLYSEECVDGDTDISSDWLEGPTVKYYFEIEDRGRTVYRLSWRKDTSTSRYTIMTHQIDPIGRVIGVYRVVRS